MGFSVPLVSKAAVLISLALPLMRQRTQAINALRAHMAELGIVAAQGREGIKDLLKIIASE